MADIRMPSADTPPPVTDTRSVNPLAHGIPVFAGAITIAGMVLAGISALLNFVWLPYSPWWSLLVIAIDVLVIWALANYHREPAPQGTRAAAL